MDKVLLFSGGRQSCVLLHILEPYLDETLVLWCNTGAASESTQEQMRKVRSTVPHFQEVRTDQPKDIALWGFPSDIVPIRHSPQSFAAPFTPKIQSTTACCVKNIWMPLALACVDSKAETIYAGGTDMMTTGSHDIIYPLHSWSGKMLQDYIHKHQVLVPQLRQTRLCWNCTGYVHDPARRAAIRELTYNDQILVRDRLQEIRMACRGEDKNFAEILSS